MAKQKRALGLEVTAVGEHGLPPSLEHVQANPILPALPRPALHYVHTQELTQNCNNPRSSAEVDDIADLVASIGQHGILEPLLARGLPVDDGNGLRWHALELIAGHRRLGAARRLGLDVVPVLVYDRAQVDAQRALELALVENLHRKDQAPMDEARAYQVLQSTGLGVEDIAAHVGRPIAHVRRRLLLLGLSPKLLAMLEGGWITAGAAEQFARLPSSEQQEHAAAEADTSLRFYLGSSRHIDAPPRDQGREAVGAHTAAVAVEMACRALDQAPWDLEATDLVAAAGACSACPKRSGAQTSLFAAGDGAADFCLDSACWRTKVDATRALGIEAAMHDGAKILTPKQSRELYPYGSMLANRELLDLDAPCELPGTAGTWRATCAGLVGDLDKAVATDQLGILHTLVERRALMAEARRSGLVKPDKKPQRDGDDARRANELAAARRLEQLEDAVLDAVVAEACSRVRGPGSTHDGVLELMARRLLGCAGHRSLSAMRRRLSAINGAPVEDLEAYLFEGGPGSQIDSCTWVRFAIELAVLGTRTDAKHGTQGQAVGFVETGLELLPDLAVESYGVSPALAMAAAAYGVSVEQIAKRLASKGKKSGKAKQHKSKKRTPARA
jgi:ParB/RepB/Spo0J family partition protein